jgi:EmrB/QacA subfamily drug resistance transporter
VPRIQDWPYKWVVAVVFVLGLFMEILDTTVVNVAIPTLEREFDAPTSTVEWVVTGYLLSLALWIPASGWLGDRFGTKRVLLFAIAMFTAASLLCALSWNIESLVAFRLLQGVGGGMMTPVGTAMLFRAFPPGERARASTVLTIPTVMAPAIGPVLGGLLTEKASWHWIFLINLPIGLLGFLFGLRYLREHTEPAAGRFDVPGFLLSGSGLALLLYALSQGPEDGWRSAPVVGTAAVGLAAMVALIVVETRKAEPMLALRLFRDRMFRIANMAMFCALCAFIGLLFLLPLFLQNLRGLTPLESGLTTFPQAIGMILMSQVVGRIYPCVGPRRLMMIGLVGATAVLFAFATVQIDTNLWWIRGLVFLRGMCMAFAFIPLQAATYATITPADTGRASALYSTTRQVAGAIGVAVLATVLLTATTNQLAGVAAGDVAGATEAQVRAFHIAFVAAALIASIGIVAAAFVRDTDAAATMVRRRPAARPAAGTAEPAPSAARAG